MILVVSKLVINALRHTRGTCTLARRCPRRRQDLTRATVRQQPAPEPRAWLVERGIGAGWLPARLHTGDCWDTRKCCVPAGAEQVRRLLAEGVPACIHCRPDSTLGPGDLLEFVRRAGLDPADVRLNDAHIVGAHHRSGGIGSTQWPASRPRCGPGSGGRCAC
ncbi:DUF6233 domain-containing protein [Streptomyces goshikiensis]|uniref:DUF6233 domain-containing protein n=1 Tax=Streptomyces goshikiensis TaxID=1942 RepID=UPI0036FB1CC9